MMNRRSKIKDALKRKEGCESACNYDIRVNMFRLEAATRRKNREGAGSPGVKELGPLVGRGTWVSVRRSVLRA